MARKCPDCGCMNDDEMAFCTECGEPLDPQVRLVMELEGKKATKPVSNQSYVARDEDDDDDDYTPMYHEEEKKKIPWALFLLIAAAAIAAYFFLR